MCQNRRFSTAVGIKRFQCTIVACDTITTPAIACLFGMDNNNNNNTLIYIAPACRMTSEALADSSSRAV